MKDTSTLKEIAEIAVNIKINEETPVLLKLPLNAKLSDVRIILNEEPEIRMNNKMSFLNRSDEITKGNETKLLLSEILIKNDLNIIGEIEPDWKAIIKMCALEYGLHFTIKGPVSAKEKAFHIKFMPEILPRPFTDEEVVECKTKEENICVRNYIANSNSSLFSELSVRSQHSTAEIRKENNIYSKFKRIKVILSINESKPTKNFLDAIDEALASHNQYESLRKVTEDFGQFLCKRYEIGGVILSTKKNETSINNLNEFYEFNSSLDSQVDGLIGIEGRIKKNRVINSEDEYSFFNIHGGLEETYLAEGMSVAKNGPDWPFRNIPCFVLKLLLIRIGLRLGWLNSLNNYKNWRVAEYSDICSIFDILDKDRRIKVAAASGKAILVSQVVKFESDPIFDLADRRPFVCSIPQNINLSDTDQMFLTVMTDDKPRKDFVARLHYIDEKSRPVILVQRLGKLKNKTTLKRFSFKLGYIIVGKSLSNLLEQKPEQTTLESLETSLITTKNRCSAVIKNQTRNPSSSHIATCVTKSKNTQSDPNDLEFIVGAHFNIRNNAIEACVFCCDQKSKKYLKLI
ncbi:7507_t:CDS:2 [Ambispora gerdemannii]|uniref:7507_t:CDS:1 n=1 Tax=Ambispora gerdemannii TaxID=144530 RepID=A0A9N9FWA5_9GLOM|nr:7507_t:CDS:2 [Ambispora gerdemannii]